MLVKILRWLLGIGIAIWGIASLRSTLSVATQFDGNTALQIAFGVVALGVSAALIASDFVRWVSRPILILIESLYMPANRDAKPPLSFRLGRFYAVNGRLSDAEKDYLRMLHFYPEEAEGWVELMTLYWTWKPEDRKSEARHACERGCKKVSNPQSRANILGAMTALKSGKLPVDFAALTTQDKAQARLPAS